MIIRPAIPTDYEFILDIFLEIVGAGETFVLPRDLSREQARTFWCEAKNKVFVGEDAGKIVGSYYLKPNHAGPGSHVANAGYIVAPDERGKQIGRSLAEHSIAQARRFGFRALQFNFVVATNERAIGLWTQLGFRVIGTLPGVFQHPAQGYVDAHVMFLELL
jgi:L-amino acid N-acyltransferase YncA